MDGLRLRYLGHSGLAITAGGEEMLVDPFITGNPRAGARLDELAPELIVITHAHGDHWGDTPTLSERTGATVVGTAEVAAYAGRLGLANHAMNIGGSHAFGAFRVAYTPAWHSSSFPDGTYGGMPAGVIIEAGGKRVYHAGDTALFSDMALVARGGLDVAFLPIGDNFTMGPADALEAVRLLKPAVVVPIHYGTFPVIAQDAAAFKVAVEGATGSSCVVLAPGEGMTL